MSKWAAVIFPMMSKWAAVIFPMRNLISDLRRESTGISVTVLMMREDKIEH